MAKLYHVLPVDSCMAMSSTLSGGVRDLFGELWGTVSNAVLQVRLSRCLKAQMTAVAWDDREAVQMYGGGVDELVDRCEEIWLHKHVRRMWPALDKLMVEAIGP
jgi:hypothetical protein